MPFKSPSCYLAEEGGQKRGGERWNSCSQIALGIKLARLTAPVWVVSQRKEKRRMTGAGARANFKCKSAHVPRLARDLEVTY